MGYEIQGLDMNIIYEDTVKISIIYELDACKFAAQLGRVTIINKEDK